MIPGGRSAVRLSRRAVVGMLTTILTPRVAFAHEHEEWRRLIPRVSPPPEMTAGALATPEEYVTLARQTAATLARLDGWVMPSAWYPMLFTRDAYWITAAHGDPAVHGAVLSRLRRAQHQSGQAPTALYIDGY